MKIGLQWQIFLGLLIGISFGIFFPTSYKITDNTVSAFQNKNYPVELIHILQIEKKDFIETETEFLKRIKPSLGPEYYELYKTEILNNSKFNPNLQYISWIGELFLRILAMITVPLIITAIISGLSYIGSGYNLGKLALKTIIYYFSTSFFAISAGLLFVNIIKPGIGVDINLIPSVPGISSSSSFRESLMNIIPVNIFDAFARPNIVSVIFFSILFGYFITKVNDRNRVLISNFFNSVFEVMIQMTNFIIKLLPLALMAIIASFVADYSGDIQKVNNILASLGNFILTILFAFIFHALIILPLLLYFVFKINPWKHFLRMRSALFTAFFTASSISTLPVTINMVNKKCGVSNKISNFTLPVGATVGLDATVLYQLISVFFIAQAYGMELNLVETVVVVTTTLLVSIGSSGIPMSGLVILSFVLSSVGLPIEGIGLLLAIDRILEMFRTTINVWSDSCGAVLIAKSEGEELNV